MVLLSFTSVNDGSGILFGCHPELVEGQPKRYSEQRVKTPKYNHANINQAICGYDIKTSSRKMIVILINYKNEQQHLKS